MTEHISLATIGQMPVADNQNSQTAGSRTHAPMQDFRLPKKPAYQNRRRNPRLTVISGSAAYGAEPVMIDVTDYAEIKTSASRAKRMDPFLRYVVGPLVVQAAAAVVAIALSIAPASDGPVSLAGPLSGHSILHFPR